MGLVVAAVATDSSGNDIHVTASSCPPAPTSSSHDDSRRGECLQTTRDGYEIPNNNVGYIINISSSTTTYYIIQRIVSLSIVPYNIYIYMGDDVLCVKLLFFYYYFSYYTSAVQNKQYYYYYSSSSSRSRYGLVVVVHVIYDT